jgi:predicted SprT family Zn-dependent metalloprotease
MNVVPASVGETFDELNSAHFGGALPRPKFVVNGLGGRFANYAPQVHLIFLHPRMLDQSRRFVADTLLHELVHYALELRTGDHDQGHGPAFVSLANEIGAKLGVPRVTLGTEAVLEWPQSVRPADYAPWQ